MGHIRTLTELRLKRYLELPQLVQTLNMMMLTQLVQVLVQDFLMKVSRLLLQDSMLLVLA